MTSLYLAYSYSTNLDEDSADIIVTLKDGSNYVIEVATPQYLLSLMEENNTRFIEPGESYIIVRKLTKEVVEEAIKCIKRPEGCQK